MTTNEEKENGLITYLFKNKDNRGIMAAFRSAMNPNKRQRCYPYLGRFNAIEDNWKSKAYQTVVCVFGYYAEMEGLQRNPTTGSISFGAVCRELMSNDEKESLNSGESKPGPLSRHFMHLLAAKGDEVFERVARLALRARRDGIMINFKSLLWELQEFKNDPEKIKRGWASKFWSYQKGGQT